ncbi:MAG TPA: hypothetical protein VFZ77_04045 [Acidimicrobiales bacterium]
MTATEVQAEAQGLVRTAIDVAARAGNLSVAGLTSALDGAGRSLTRRVVAGAEGAHEGLDDTKALARALRERPRTPSLAGATGAAMVLRLARRTRLNILVRRTPAFLVAAAAPALVASVSRGADELGMVAAHLISRARAAGVEPDLERVRRAAVQIVGHRVVDPEVEPSHGALVLAWLRRAARAALPFTAGVATADPKGMAAAAAAVDPTLLGPA